nr:protein Skeletor, isoforms D/E-like [Leptinotarsa decemlineata]
MGKRNEVAPQTVPGKGLHHFRRMPCELHNAAATWQKFLEVVLGTKLETLVFIYLDDIIIVMLNYPTTKNVKEVRGSSSKLNCEVLYDDLAFEVRWAVAGESIVLQLVAKLDDREYMSFGPSGDDSSSVMIGGDVVVAWVDKKTLKGYADDYYLEDKSQCSGPTGSCPDNRLKDNSNNIRLLNAAMVNGYSIVTYQRPLRASDEFDRQIFTNHTQAIIWAIGPLNQRKEVSFHSSYLKKNRFIDFGRPAKWNCPMPENEQPSMVPLRSPIKSKVAGKVEEEEEEYEAPVKPTTNSPRRSNGNGGRRRGSVRGNARVPEESAGDSENSASRNREQTQQRRRIPQREASTAVRSVPPPTPVKKREAWDIPPIQCYEPEDGVFYAQMGPTGGKRGYPAITGHVGWGISWYINGLLIPEINVVRGKTYTFVVEGGLDPEVSAKYHPFYITDDPIGGYEYKTPEERKNVRNFAGVRVAKDGTIIPTGTGRLCHWTQTGDLEADDFQSFGAYQRTLELKCDQGEPGVIQWTPDADTPDTVYYQCFTHRHLGWKIHVHDYCDEQPAASETKITIVAAPSKFLEKSGSDLDESPSIRIETRVKPNTIIKEVKDDSETKYTISEKEVNPEPHPDPHPKEGNPKWQLPNENILTTPQQSYYNSFHQRTKPHIQMHAINPYYLEPLHHMEQNRNFRTSTPSNTAYESTSSHSEMDQYNSNSTTSTTTTEAPSTSQSSPQVTDILAIDTVLLNETYLQPPPALPHKPLRRPVLNHSKYPMPTVIKMRPPAPIRNFGIQMLPHKKQIIRAPFRIHSPRPSLYDYNKKYLGSSVQRPLSTNIIVTQSYPPITKAPPIHSQAFRLSINGKTEKLRNVEVSAQQPSTEREPEIQTAPSTSAIDISLVEFMRPAFNTGFKPDSVKIEGGFKPIITKEFQDRVDLNEPEIGLDGEKGMVKHESKYEYKPFHVFEPVFVPSPTFKPLKEKQVHKRPVNKKRQQYVKIVVKHPRSLTASEELQEAAAAERVESYYLPPLNQKPIDRVQEPSNIDIELPESSLDIASPPDVVVTYDGKKVSGQSLTAKLSERSSFFDRRISKASAFITGRPQFGQFKGELPPLNIDSIDKNAPQLQASARVLSRDLDTPPLPTEVLVSQSSIRLARVGGARNKRAAHHTHEHTAQQEAERLGNSTQSEPSKGATDSVSEWVVLLCIFCIQSFGYWQQY